jgi:uncharacterized protein GlcG (DUF336 family)
MRNLVKATSSAGLKALTGFMVAALFCGGANAQENGKAQGAEKRQGLVTQRNLSLAMAKTVAETALATCQAKGYHTAVAVVDRAGQVLVILRDEQATAQHAEMARRKAYTARMFRISTTEFQKRTADGSLAAQRDLPDVLALGGGVPIKVGDDTIGAVASAGSNQEQDDACAKAGIGKVADLLK